MEKHLQGWNVTIEESFKLFKQKGLNAGGVISQIKGNYLVTVKERQLSRKCFPSSMRTSIAKAK